MMMHPTRKLIGVPSMRREAPAVAQRDGHPDIDVPA
jgi:hypothetical protein